MRTPRNATHKTSNLGVRLWVTIRFLFPRFVGTIRSYFLRKTNTFIKSKYSKNRQWSRSVVYFGLWFGVISALVFTYHNYRFIVSLSYLWWFGAALPLITMIFGLRKYGVGIKPSAFINL